MACSVFALGMALSAPVYAQAAAPAAPHAADDSKLEDVVVTARKRSESIDTVPLAITAMSADKIEARNLKSLEDVAAFSPGFYTQSQTGTGAGRNDRSFRQLTFRGIGASSTNVGPFAGGVAFLDGSPVLNSSLANVQDLERVEVLRGPQSAYFGRSTFIGAINYITKDPTSHWTGRVTAEVAEDDLVDTSLAVSGPIIPDVMSFRLSGRHFRKGGQYQTSNSNVRLGSQGTDAISLTILTKPVDGLRIRTFANYFEDSDGPPAQYYLGGKTIRAGGANCNLGGTGGGYYCGTVPQVADRSLISANLSLTPQLYGDLVQNVRNFPLPFNYADYLTNFGLKRKATQLSNRIDYDFGGSGYTLSAITAYHDEKIVTLNDLGFRANPTYQFSTTVGYRDYDWSQELRIVSPVNKRLRFVAGGNYVKVKQSSSGIIGQFGAPGAPFTVFNFAAAQVGYTQARTPSVFGGVYFDIVPALTLSVEGRYQWDKISVLAATSATSFISAEKTFTSFSPRVSLDYKLTPTSTIYALFSRGYKPGGFNGGSILSQPQFILDQLASTGASGTYDQEKLDNYEAGIKGSFFDNRLRLALNGYVGRYSNAQIPQPKTVYTTQTGGVTNTGPGAPQNTLSPIVSVGRINLQGIEFEGEAILFPGLRIGATLAYTDTKIKYFFCNECASILAQNPGYVAGTSPLANSVQVTSTLGKRLPGAPKITYTLSASYEGKISDKVTAYIGGDYLYRGNYFADAANIASSGASEVFNARIGVRWDNFNIEVFARNLFNNESPSVAYGVFDSELHPAGSAANTVLIGLPDRRRIGVRASANF
jgi:iron complex outermembrane receptor protein